MTQVHYFNGRVLCWSFALACPCEGECVGGQEGWGYGCWVRSLHTAVWLGLFFLCVLALPAPVLWGLLAFPQAAPCPWGGSSFSKSFPFLFLHHFPPASVSLHGFGACTPRVTCRDMAGQQAAEREPLGTSNMSLVPSWVFALPMPPCILPTILDFPCAGGLRVLDL